MRKTIIVDDAPSSRSDALTPGAGATAPGPVEAYLAGLDAEELRALVRDLAVRYGEVARALDTAAALDAGDGRTIRARLADRVSALGRPRFLDYWRAMDYAGDVEEVLGEIEQVIALGHPDAAAPVALRVTKRLRSLLERADDSAGALGGCCQRAVDLYARACREGSPQPTRLGRWLAAFRDESPGWPEVTLADFAPALGTRGITAYRNAVQALNAEVETTGRDSFRRDEVDRMLLELADHDGDVDSAVVLLARRERIGYGGIVRRLLEAQRVEEAVTWADRAVKDGAITVNGHFTASLGSSIAEVWLGARDVVDLYLDQGRAGDALDLVRYLFRRGPAPNTWDLLTETAARLDQEGEERAQALTWIDAQEWRDGATVIALALYDGDPERAWEAADRWGPGSQWQALADLTPQPRPAQAAEYYEQAFRDLLPTLGRDAARRQARLAVTVLQRAAEADAVEADAGRTATRGQDFNTWLTQWCVENRRRRAVIEELAAVGLPRGAARRS